MSDVKSCFAPAGSSDRKSTAIVPKLGCQSWFQPWQRWDFVDEASIIRRHYYEFQRFNYHDLEAATRKHCVVENYIGKGPYGNLFRASVNLINLAAPTLYVLTPQPFIVEQVDPVSCRLSEKWSAEVENLGKKLHPNLLKLVGYAFEEPGRALLIYGPLPKDNLRNHLSDGSEPPWSRVLNIALGVARGLYFLHTLNPPHIWRCPTFDTTSILLDWFDEPKIYNYGLTTNSPSGSIRHATTRFPHAFANAAPEYHRTGKLTATCNVYSFGVFLLQMITGREPFDESRPCEEQILVDWARPLLSKGKILNIMDPKLQEELHYFVSSTVTRVCQLAEDCIEPNARRRPSMASVYRTLHYEVHGNFLDETTHDGHLQKLVDFVAPFIPDMF